MLAGNGSGRLRRSGFPGCERPSPAATGRQAETRDERGAGESLERWKAPARRE